MAISLPLRSECIACWLWITKLPAQSFNCSALRFHADVSGCSVTEDCVTQHETSHDTVLKNGAVPLEILKAQVNDYIQRKKSTWAKLRSNESRITRIPRTDEEKQFRVDKQDSGGRCIFYLRYQRNPRLTKVTMRRILITLAILVVCIATVSATWIFRGRQISLFIDRFGTVETASARINSITYEGSGTGGILHVNDLALSLNAADSTCSTPNIGSTKDGQLALAAGGKVFAFGPPRSEAENLATVPPAGDNALIAFRRSVLSWPTPFDPNFMTGHSPSWKRHLYYQVRWHKQNGAKLEMLWRYEQYFYSDQGWLGGTMTREGATGLIRIDISNAAR